jgi:DNA-binding NarL/FixJ family response regulator
VRVVICDEDALLREMVEALVTRLGHEIIGITDTTAAGVALIEAGRPEVVIYDMALGYNTDFDVIASAVLVGAHTIIFSHTAEEAILGQYAPHPTVVEKPDLVGLEHVLARLERDEEHHAVVEHERRTKPARAASGPPSTGVTDAQAFYEALNDVARDDALVTIELATDGTDVARALLELMRGTDRLVASLSTVRVFLPGGGEEGVQSFLRRLREAALVPSGTVLRSIVVRDGEAGSDAFDRLKAHGEAHSV